MPYNFITNIVSCSSGTEISNFLGQSNFSLIYYTHIPVIIVSLLIGFFVIFKNHKIISARVLFFLSIIFSLWVLSNLMVWISPDSRSIMFFWSLFGILDCFLYVCCLFLVYTYESNKDLLLNLKIFLGTLILPIIILTPTIYNVKNFDYNNCTVNDNLFFKYIFIVKAILAITLIIAAIYKYINARKELRKRILLMSLGVSLFLLTIFLTGYISDTFQLYTVEAYGIIAMTIFMGFIAYLIVKFKAFNIKLVGAQALVWASVILIGSQFFYLRDSALSVKILTAITLIISSILGLVLVRSVKKEDVLNEKLLVANSGQKNLIHIMNHQIKGYLGINRNIFAELLTDDYGKVPEEARDLIMKGKENSEGGVEYVTGILRGDSAESGSLTFDMKAVDFKEIVSGVIEKIKGAIEKKGLKLSVDTANGAYNILGDSIQLGEAVRNLIENSMHYTPSGEISIRLKQAGGKVLLSVKDTGVGIKKEDKDKLFKAGGVGSESIKINVNSSGYGLAFVKGVVEKHNGKVWFESAGAGKGSTFFVELPVK